MKYRHRGYRDSDRDKDKEHRKTKPKSPQERGLRHMMERSAKLIVRCHQCSVDTGPAEGLTSLSTCSNCEADLRVCRTCAHFDTGARWECQAPITEPVQDKTTANSCTHFKPNTVLDATGRRSGTGSASDARTAFDNLFKKK